jgi:hypothetical protein
VLVARQILLLRRCLETVDGFRFVALSADIFDSFLQQSSCQRRLVEQEAEDVCQRLLRIRDEHLVGYEQSGNMFLETHYVALHRLKSHGTNSNPLLECRVAFQIFVYNLAVAHCCEE